MQCLRLCKRRARQMHSAVRSHGPVPFAHHCPALSQPLYTYTVSIHKQKIQLWWTDVPLLRRLLTWPPPTGLQGIVEHFGGQLGKLQYPMHGKPSPVQLIRSEDKLGVFEVRL